MGIEEIVSVSISLSGASPTQANFGIGALVAYHTQFTDRVRQYSSLAAVATDFPPASTATGVALVYAAAEVFFAPNPAPTPFKVGRRASAFTETYTLTITDTDNEVVSFMLDGKSISATGASSSATAAALAAAIVAAGVVSATATQTGSVVTVTATTAGHVLRFQNWNINLVDLENTTTDPGLTADLAAIAVADNDFYAFAIDSHSATQCNAASTWAESATLKEFFCQSSDTLNTTSSTLSVMAVMKSESHKKTVPIYNGNDTWGFSGVAAMAYVLPQAPGSYSLDLKQLVDVIPDTLTDTQAANVLANNGNVYRTIAGENVITRGTNSNGGFEDTTRFIDWLQNTMQVRVFGALVAAKKMPYTNKGVRALGAIVSSVLADGITVGGLSDDPDEKPIVTLPLPVSAIAASYITTRALPPISFQAWLAGAIQDVSIVGTLIGA